MRKTSMLFVFVGMLACNEKKATTAHPTMLQPQQAEISAAAKEAADIFNTRCVTCHGAAGKGDGAAAQALTPKPRDFTDAAWQKTATDDNLKKVIVEGGPAVGKSPLMPPNFDLKEKADVVAELVKKVRSFAK